jgi:hypothetical protein
MKSKIRPHIETKPAGAEDQKMSKIVDEVDRFFQSVHADIEDWKFSMEDSGDGTRIFVRFQIHINKPMESSKSKKIAVKEPVITRHLDEGESPSHEPGRVRPERLELTGTSRQPDGSGDGLLAESDLASFVELWRRKRDSNQGGEYHKEGAPYMETQLEWEAHIRRSGDRSDGRISDAHDESSKHPNERI